MGNVFSSAQTRERTAKDVIISGNETMNNASISSDPSSEEEINDVEEQLEHNSDNDEARYKAREDEMNEFKTQLNIKREQRREILARHRNEKKKLEKSLESERKSKLELYESNKLLRELLIKNNIEIPDNLKSTKEDINLTDAIIQMKEEFEILKSNNSKLRRDLAESSFALQGAYSDIADLNSQNTESLKQINALKEVISVSKTMINLREQQLNELKNKLNDIEQSLADRETNILSADLRQEYERQLQNIRTLRGLYEERARLAEVTRQSLVRELEEQKLLNQVEVNKCKDLTLKVEELEAELSTLQETIENNNYQISTCQDEARGLKSEMSAVNKLFSQVLLGYKTKQDLDKLVHRLEENHGLLTHMAERENGSETSSALPKLLLELVSQVDEVGNKNNSDINTDNENDSTTPEEDKTASELESPNSLNTTAEEIVQNLPKVWRVLIELLSHQSVSDVNTSEKVTTCYQSVETKSGPVLVPSVSQTYIRLKDLIIEKLALIKEVNRMKQLNTHLETRLEEQEKRLCLVTTELSKTWHVVGRLRRHHHQLHTHEKILKYELQQKRKLLNELKEELEYCREKWEQAREKNSQSERDWRKLRAEFSSRKTKSNSPSFNNSAESGYSDERPSDDSSESNDESEYVTEPPVRCKKKNKKSFETILDSSTDFNLAAEREDPVSDMLDVTDLPLDTQDGDDNQEASVSDSCNSENFIKNKKLCEETEDEIGDIANDSCVEDLSAAEHYCENDYCCVGLSSTNESGNRENKSNKEENEHNINHPTSSTLSEAPKLHNTSLIDPAAILNSIKQQNERLAAKDKKLENLEKSSAALLKKTQTTAKFSEQLDNTLDHLINRPTSSKQTNDSICGTKPQNTLIETKIEDSNAESIRAEIKLAAVLENIKSENENDKNLENVESITENLGSTSMYVSSNENDGTISELNSMQNCSEQKLTSLPTENECGYRVEPSSSHVQQNDELEDKSKTPNIDCKAILENIRQQNERLAKKDDRLQSLKNCCSQVVKNINHTLNTGEVIMEKLDTLHNKHRTTVPEQIESVQSLPEQDCSAEDLSHLDEPRAESEPSTSSELNHEAIFAARDLRLKRLEEQTKSLVNKVNKTTTKGVKIHYKLEELHNIYGSESSRAGTPSEDNEDKSQTNENETNDD